MAQRQYDVVLGQDKTSLTEAAGSSISTSAVRVTVDDGNAVSKTQALMALEAVKQRIIEDTWPAS